MTNFEDQLAAILAEDEPATIDGAPLTDAGNAECFAHDHRAYLRWVPEWGSWLRFDGARWRRIAGEETIRLGIQTARGMLARAAQPGVDRERAAALASHALRTESAGKLEAMIRLARGFLVERADAFDRDPMALNVANGTLDLRTGALRPHRRDDLITMLSPIAYLPSATCPRWEAFLARVLPDPDVRAFVQRFVGYCLTGDVGEQVLAFFFGRGANGKSTLIEVVLHVLAEYAKTAAPDLLLAKNSEAHPTEQADLKGARLAVCQEVEAGRAWAERTIKALTGGDAIKARLMRCDFFEFRPTHKILVAANHRPRVRGQEEAIWRRIRLVPFEVTIPKSERDPELADKLRAEAAGILRWAVEGCLAWRADGLGEPGAVANATAAYREEQDHLGHFIEDELELAPDAFEVTSVLFEAYRSWCARSGHEAWKRDAFREGLLERRGGLAEHRMTRGRGIKGVRVRRVADQVVMTAMTPEIEFPG